MRRVNARRMKVTKMQDKCKRSFVESPPFPAYTVAMPVL